MHIVKSVVLFAITCFIFLGAKNSCEKQDIKNKVKEEYSADSKVETLEDIFSKKTACTNDTDCVEIKDGCCDCRHGGKKTAIHLKDFNAARQAVKSSCKDIVCAAVISEHPSCDMKPKCINNTCTVNQ